MTAMEFQCGPDGNHKLGNRDLRRRLMAKVGVPLTASAHITDDNEMSDRESVADSMFNSLVSSVYGAAYADTASEPTGDER
jgi:hypothetical protein